MTGEPRPPADDHAHELDVLGPEGPDRDLVLAWVREHLTEVRESASGQRVFSWILGVGLVVGLAAHVGGFLLKTSATTEPWSLLADLLYALGWALWTSVVVVVFVQIWPEAKRRQYKQVLAAYEAAVGDRARAKRGQTPDPADAGEGGQVPPD